MTRLRKDEMLEIVGMLETVNDKIRENGHSIPAQTAVEAFVHCQEQAVLMGNYLETLGEKAEPLVKIIEAYCANLYESGLAISKGGQYKNLSNQIRIQLSQLKQGIRRDLPDDRRQIVFLPYKADMWDSMESVWEAAREDEACDVYVIPIPYFERNHDGTLGTAHCEAERFPPYVPVTSWKNYSLEENRPDMIYIHNPYDEQNYVTTVHPAFYSKKLKNYTNMLVYIPYFIGVNVKAEKQFCVLPGTIYADRVILESEAIRRIYIEEFHEFERKNRLEGRIQNAEERFLALGSPKYDKVLRAEKQSPDIPANWLRVMMKADGARKKIVFYNTGVGALLNQKEKLLEKIGNVLKLFRKYQEDVALLWRPHPLLEATVKSMLPRMETEYKTMVDSYRQEAWGIYDNSADMDRAVAISDAYYGDMSSLVSLFEATGKQVMIQNSDGNLQEAESCCQYLLNAGEGLLCTAVFYGFISTNSLVDTKKLAGVWHCDHPRFEEGFPVGPFSYTVSKIGTKTYFAPRWYVNDNHLAVLDDAANEFEYIALHKETGRLLDDEENNSLKKWEWADSLYYSNSPKFQGMIRFQDSLFITPSSYPAIVKLDMVTKEVLYYTDFIDEVIRISETKGSRSSYAFGSSLRMGTKIYMTCRWSDLLVEFDMETCAGRVIQLSGRGYGNQLILSDGTSLWLLSNQGPAVTRWNPASSEIRVFDGYPDEIADFNGWQSAAFFDGSIVAVAVNYDHLPLKIDVCSGEILVADELMEAMGGEGRILSLCAYRDKLYFIDGRNQIFEISEWNGVGRSANFSITKSTAKHLHRNLAKYYADAKISVMTEHYHMELESYLDAIEAGSFVKQAARIARDGAGKRIHECIKNESSAAPWKVRIK